MYSVCQAATFLRASNRLVNQLSRRHSSRSRPQAIRCDNGPEFTSRHFLAWALEWKIELRHIQPGKPTQNAHVESFHGRLREECLRVSYFANLFDARRKVSYWKMEYNEQRPHSSLGYRTPAEFARVAMTQSYGKDVGSAHWENASGASHYWNGPPIVPQGRLFWFAGGFHGNFDDWHRPEQDQLSCDWA